LRLVMTCRSKRRSDSRAGAVIPRQLLIKERDMKCSICEKDDVQVYPIEDCYRIIRGYICDDCTDEAESQRQRSAENGV